MSGGEQPGASPLTHTTRTVAAGMPTDDGASPKGRAPRPTDCERSTTPSAQHRAGLPSSVIHELRTPLTSIHGYAQVLQRTLHDNPRATNALTIVIRETTRLATMLNELSELAEIESGDVVATPTRVEVHQVLDDVIQEIARRDGGDHAITMQGAATANCNATLLSHALSHVLTNAVRYSPLSSPVDVQVGSHDDVVEIVVQDRGISILPPDTERVYEVFARGANARQAGIRGIGLGLFLAKHALAHAGGTIGHETREGGGTSFRITVPRA